MQLPHVCTSHAGFMVRMRYSRNLLIGARWEETFLPIQGKVTQNEWRDVEADFKTAWGDVKDPSPKEGRKTLFQQIPPFIVRCVVEEEKRKMTSHPIVIINDQTRPTS